MSNGNSYEENAIDFIKYALFFSSLEKQIAIPEKLTLNFDNELLQKVYIIPNYFKDSIQLDLVVKNLSKKELEEFLDNLKNNIFLKERLNLKNYSDTQNFDLLIEVARNYFSQSQDKYFQLYTYIGLIKIMNLLKNSNKKDKKMQDNYENICNKLKVSKNNEKIFVLITDGSYHLLSQIIQFSKKNKYENIKDQNVIEEKEYSFDYTNEVDKVLSNLIANTSLSKIFAKNKNNRNIPNLNKFFNILSDLEQSGIPHCIIYYEDELKISMDNQILNEMIYQLIYNKSNFEKKYNGQFKEIENKIIERDYINVVNLPVKCKINEFINLLTTEEIKIKRLFNNYYNDLEKNNKLIEVFKDIKKQLEKVNFFKNNKLKIYLDQNHKSSLSIFKYLKDVFTCEFILLDLNCKDYKAYLSKINKEISEWLGDIYTHYSSFNFNKILFTENGKLGSNNILEVIQYNINKHFNNKIIIDKKTINLTDLEYDETIKEDKSFYNDINNILNGIMEKLKEIFKRGIEIKGETIKSLINNCKCYYLYSNLFDSIKFNLCRRNRNDIDSAILKIFE